MTETVVVVGSGYAGAGAVQSFEREADDAGLVWISDTDYHLMLHEAHRCIRNPSVESKIAIPIDEIKSDETQFRKTRVTNVDTDAKRVETADGDDQPYDYLLLAVGTRTAFYGIDGLREHALTLKSLDDVREIHHTVTAAAEDASADDPTRIVVGGAGLSGIQTAGELAELRDDEGYEMEIQLVEGLDDVLPGQDPELQGRLRRQLERANVEILTGEFISEVDDETVSVGDEDGEELPYDVLIWTGGITGRDELAGANVDKDDRSNRVHAGATFETSADGVLAIGDTALVDQGDEEVAPPTAQAAWQAAEVAGENLARACRGAPLKSWRHEDKGTLVSVGEEAVAHDVIGVPIRTFGGLPARFLKKAVAARWIATVASPGRAVTAWADM